MPNGAGLFVQAAAQFGLDPLFTLVGDHLNEVLAAAVRATWRTGRRSRISIGWGQRVRP